MTEVPKVPDMIAISGPGLKNMDPDRYARFVAGLSELGMAVAELSLPLVDAPIPSQGGSEEGIPTSPVLVTKEDFCSFAFEHNYTHMAVRTAWNGLRRIGKYFPLLPQSTIHASLEASRPIFYYDPALLTGKLAASGEQFGIYFERGFTVEALTRCSNIWRPVSALRTSSSLDVQSLKAVDDRGAWNIGSVSRKLMSHIYAHRSAVGQVACMNVNTKES